MLNAIAVGTDELDAATGRLADADRAAIDAAIANVERFHVPQLRAPVRIEIAAGVFCERVQRPLDAVGLYVPGGTAPLPSTAIMLAVARIAGCRLRILCTPPRADGSCDPAVLYVARACGIEHVFKAGGAQAIAAMAFGTESVPRVDKIFGPGNAWVTTAKQVVAADAGGAALDMPAGPSEVLVIADDTAYYLGDAYKLPGGGPGLATKTVEQFIGVPINYYAQIDFGAFVRFIDEIGGVKINIPEAIKVDLLGPGSATQKMLQPGVQVLPGEGTGICPSALYRRRRFRSRQAAAAGHYGDP